MTEQKLFYRMREEDSRNEKCAVLYEGLVLCYVIHRNKTTGEIGSITVAGLGPTVAKPHPVHIGTLIHAYRYRKGQDFTQGNILEMDSIIKGVYDTPDRKCIGTRIDVETIPESKQEEIRKHLQREFGDVPVSFW